VEVAVREIWKSWNDHKQGDNNNQGDHIEKTDWTLGPASLSAGGDASNSLRIPCIFLLIAGWKMSKGKVGRNK
jgi:hypothetical protein